ncbi:MAG: peptide deformylase [Endozoicomonas sp.]
MKLPVQPEVLIMGHPLLFQSQPQVSVDTINTGDFRHNLKVLKQQQIDTQGVGLAAPQVGWAARVLSMGISDENRSRYPRAPDIPFCFWINPEIIDVSDETCWTWEACLSVPGMRAWIERPSEVRVAGYDHQGERVEQELSGFVARVMQHEMDHLNGILFPKMVEDKSLIIPNEAIFRQDQWADDWPTPSARVTPRGQISPTR